MVKAGAGVVIDVCAGFGVVTVAGAEGAVSWMAGVGTDAADWVAGAAMVFSFAFVS